MVLAPAPGDGGRGVNIPEDRRPDEKRPLCGARRLPGRQRSDQPLAGPSPASPNAELSREELEKVSQPMPAGIRMPGTCCRKTKSTTSSCGKAQFKHWLWSGALTYHHWSAGNLGNNGGRPAAGAERKEARRGKSSPGQRKNAGWRGNPQPGCSHAQMIFTAKVGWNLSLCTHKLENEPKLFVCHCIETTCFFRV